jgi:hypothetical protein
MIALGVVLVLVLGGYLFREPLMNAIVERMTADMFVTADTDDYDPGVATGEKLPAIRARHDGAEITDIRRFMGTNGTVLIANRSVDW